jgi:hypothetical protein
MNGFALHTIIRGLLRRTWLVALVTVAVCAGFTAHAVAALVEADYLAPPAHGSSPQERVQVAPKVRSRPDGAGLVARNMFCSTCDPVVAASGPTGSTPTGLAATLIATSVGDDPRATVRVPSTEVQGSWGLAETIPGVGKIDRIGWVSIDVIDDTGARRKISLLDVAVGHSDAGAATPAAGPAANAWADRIRKLDDHTYDVDRELVKELVTGAAKPGAARMLPLVENGDVKGVKFYGVNAASLAGALGMKSGDVLSAVDGEPIKSAQQMLDLYAKVDQLSSVEFGGTRAGKPLALRLNLK